MNEDSPGEPGTLPGMHKCTIVFSFRSPPPLISCVMFNKLLFSRFVLSIVENTVTLLEQQQ
jgi:hypothetical protein